MENGLQYEVTMLLDRNESSVSKARSRRVGRPSRSVPTSVGATRLIIDPCCSFSGCSRAG